jgi:hypothetical protein
VPSAISVTFDNLGEAADLERGQWPGGETLGRHRSVTRALPRILELLVELALGATFFVEGVNAQLYPQPLQEIDAAGHEVAFHGWRHEVWADLDANRERALLRRGIAAFAEIGLKPVGLRPPGGRLAGSSIDALGDAGLTCCSPAGEGVGMRGRSRYCRFAGRSSTPFTTCRASRGGEPLRLAPEVVTPAALWAHGWRRHTTDDVQRRVSGLVVPPVPRRHPRSPRSMRAVLTDVRDRAAAGAVWCAPLRKIALWLREQPSASARHLHLDEG